MKKQRVKVVVAGYALVAFSCPVLADPVEDMEECRSVSVEAERLACFDAAWGQMRAAGLTNDSVLKSSIVETPEKPVSEAIESPKSRASFVGRLFRRKSTKAVDGSARPAAPTLTPVSAADPDGTGASVQRDVAGRVTGISATISAVRTNTLKQTTITLSNGQVWRSKLGRLKLSTGDDVTISREGLGGYFLQKGGGRKTRVYRIDTPKGETTVAFNRDVSPGLDEKSAKEGSFLSRIKRPFSRNKDESAASVNEEPQSSVDAQTTSGDADEQSGFGRSHAESSADVSEEIFGRTRASKGDRQSEVNVLIQKVESSLVDPYDHFIITLENGQVWRQVEGRLKVKTGDTVSIQKTVAGGFFLQLNGEGRRVRVRRVD